MAQQEKLQKDKFQIAVVQALLNSGFKDIFEQQQHKDFIQMIAATYFSNELTFGSIIEYLADIIEGEPQRKKIAEIIRDIKTPEVQKKPVHHRQKEQKVQRKPEKKVKQEHPPRPKETKNQNTDQPKEQIQGQIKNNNLGGEKKGLKRELDNQGKTKCRFFPFCKNPDDCKFYHPTEKCQYFPNCRYGENCLYLHEGCRFKQKCTKMNCPYAHPGKRPSNPLQAFMKQMMMGKNSSTFNKKKGSKRPNHQDAQQEEQPEQQ